MPALKPTDYSGEIVWLGVVPDRDASLASRPRQSLALSFAGPEGETHGGLTRPSCSRVVAQYPKGTEIRNTRQLSVVAQEDLDAIAAKIGVEAFDPTWIGATLVLRGLPDLTHLPPSSRLQAEDGASIVVDMENRPCMLPAKVIEGDAPGHGRAFKAAAAGRRGVTAWVEAEGTLHLGERLSLHVPDQPAWQPGGRLI